MYRRAVGCVSHPSLPPPPVTEHNVNILAGGGTVGGGFERLFPTQRIVFSVAQEFVVPFVLLLRNVASWCTPGLN